MTFSIALDMDDTLAGTLRHLFRMYKRPIPTTWLFYNDSNNIQYSKFIRDVKNTWYRHWGEISPVESGQAAVVKELSTIGTVDIVTVGSPESKAEWARMHGIQHNELISVNSGQDKAKLDYDVFIDDSPVNFQAFKEAGKQCILFDAEYNQDVDAKHRIKSLKEAPAIVRKMASLI